MAIGVVLYSEMTDEASSAVQKAKLETLAKSTCFSAERHCQHLSNSLYRACESQVFWCFVHENIYVPNNIFINMLFSPHFMKHNPLVIFK